MALAQYAKLPKACNAALGAMAVALCPYALTALFLAGSHRDHLPKAYQGKGSPCRTFLECTTDYQSIATPHQRDICWTVSRRAVGGQCPGCPSPVGPPEEERQITSACQKDPLLQRLLPTDGKARLWVFLPQ